MYDIRYRYCTRRFDITVKKCDVQSLRDITRKLCEFSLDVLMNKKILVS